MITFNTLGGHGQLGNQMFQYASLIGVKYKNNYNIVFSQTVKNSSYLFNFFNLTEYTINNTSITNEYKESTFHFNSDIFNISDNISLFGLFQSEKYFEHCSDIVKKEFIFKEKIVEEAKNILQPYFGKNLVSLHIRRGDYLAYPNHFPQCPIEYYQNAMNLLDTPNTQFICVSNDIEWCQENIKHENIIYTSNSLEVDMCILSLCSHNIIANSTFSWWGAYLNINPDKKVIAPKTWFGSAYDYHNTKDIYCNEFIKL